MCSTPKLSEMIQLSSVKDFSFLHFRVGPWEPFTGFHLHCYFLLLLAVFHLDSFPSVLFLSLFFFLLFLSSSCLLDIFYFKLRTFGIYCYLPLVRRLLSMRSENCHILLGQCIGPMVFVMSLPLSLPDA